jgi:hypothetical protein
MALPIWHPPARIEPSPMHSGEPTKEVLHKAVGSALSEWERLEIAMADLFGCLVETSSAAAQRAYGTLFGVNARHDAIEAALIEFFWYRPDPIVDDLFKLLRAYQNLGSTATI